MSTTAINIEKLAVIIKIPSTNSPAFIQNSTNFVNGTYDEKLGIPLHKRIVYQTAAITLSLMVLYVVFALLKYNWRKSDCRQKGRKSSLRREGTPKKRSKNSGGTSDSSTSTSNNNAKYKSTNEHNARILRFMCVVASILTFIRVASEQLELAPPNESRLDCRDYQIAMVVTYCLAITMLYAILWYRVKIFLSHPAMRHLGSKILNILAYVVVFIIGAASVANAVMFLVSTVSHDSVEGCMVLSPGDVVSNSARFAILTVSTVISQVSLLALFLYPLVRHRATMRAGKINTPSSQRRSDNSSVKGGVRTPAGTLKGTLTRRGNASKKQRRQKALVKIIRRVMVTAILCAISDVFCGVIVQIVVEEPRIITNIIFDLNLVINLACVLASFKDWRVRLFPCCAKKRKQHQRRKRSLSSSKPSVKQRRLELMKTQIPSSPAGFTTRETTRTHPIYHTSESGVNSPSGMENSSAEPEKEHSAEKTTSEDTGRGKSL